MDCLSRNDLFLKISTICYNMNHLLPDIIYFWHMRVEWNEVDKKLEYLKSRGNEKM